MNMGELIVIEGRLTLDGVFVDFNDIDMRLIKKSAHNANQPVIKAIGKTTQHVIDLTCGYGKDAYLFLCTGRTVTGVERNSKVYELLKDAIERHVQESEHTEELTRFKLIRAEAKDFVEGLSPEQYPDAYYIDPMYPSRKTSALPRKDIQVLRKLLASDLEEDSEVREAKLKHLIDLCLEKTKKRVVLKRPVWLDPLIKPKVSFEGKLVRYDVYVRD